MKHTFDLLAVGFPDMAAAVGFIFLSGSTG
jgi:hypothetical protein